MAERFKAAVLKTVERKLRGFESLSLRHLFYTIERIANGRSEIHDATPASDHGEVAERLKAAAC
jgi:hypothetical protein